MKRTHDQMLRNKIFVYDDIDNSLDCREFPNDQNYSSILTDDIFEVVEYAPKILITFYFEGQLDHRINVFNIIEDPIPPIIGAYVTFR